MFDMQRERPECSPTAATVLLVGVHPYLFHARVAMGFRAAGFAVEVLSPRKHPFQLLQVPLPHHSFGLYGPNSLGRFGAHAAIERAVRRARPDLIIPCDDPSAALLYAVCAATADPHLRRLIEASLGPRRTFVVLRSRTAQVALARDLGLRVPPSQAIADTASLAHALAAVGLPALMKRDGTCAGQGIAAVHDAAEAARALHDHKRASSLLNTLRQIRARGWRVGMTNLRNGSPAVHLQARIAGRPAHAAVVCRDGEVIARTRMAAVATTDATGPASVVTSVENAEMDEAVERMARHLSVNGLLGFDFMIAPGGEAYFLEINARATPTAALLCRGGQDLLGALYTDVTGRAAAHRAAIASETIAFFPHEIGRDRASPYLTAGHHDIPDDEPALVAFGLKTVGLGGRGPRTLPSGCATTRRVIMATR